MVLGRGDDVCGWERCFFVRFVNVRVAACVYPTAPDKKRSRTCMCVAVYTASEDVFERLAAAVRDTTAKLSWLVSYTTLANSMGGHEGSFGKTKYALRVFA